MDGVPRTRWEPRAGPRDAGEPPGGSEPPSWLLPEVTSVPEMCHLTPCHQPGNARPVLFCSSVRQGQSGRGLVSEGGGQGHSPAFQLHGHAWSCGCGLGPRGSRLSQPHGAPSVVGCAGENRREETQCRCGCGPGGSVRSAPPALPGWTLQDVPVKSSATKVSRKRVSSTRRPESLLLLQLMSSCCRHT